MNFNFNPTKITELADVVKKDVWKSIDTTCLQLMLNVLKTMLIDIP